MSIAIATKPIASRRIHNLLGPIVLAVDDLRVGWTLGTIGGDPLVSFVCDDASVYVGPAPPDDLDKLVAVAVGFASQHGCRAMAMAPTECLGIASDPVACNE
ncbi:MAG: hypothetical protein GY788_08695 [bacterium]|nr:hypothetical protein [bacterium]